MAGQDLHRSSVPFSAVSLVLSTASSNDLLSINHSSLKGTSRDNRFTWVRVDYAFAHLSFDEDRLRTNVYDLMM